MIADQKVEAVKMILRDPFAGLLPNRTEQVARLIADGYVTSEIADRLGIAISTVKAHRTIIKNKIGIEPRLCGEYVFRRISEAVNE